jgi:perosamine synthetase
MKLIDGSWGMREETGERIPMSSPDLTSAEIDAVMAVLGTPRLSMGPQIDAFESAVAKWVGTDHAIAVSSGTTGLHLCIRAADIRDGDLVITSPFSFIASANVILYERAIPVFVDVDPETGNIDPGLVAEAVHDIMRKGRRERWLPRQGYRDAGRIKALLPVDVFGQPADYERLNPIADEFDLAMIEDSCEALGAEYRGISAGRLGDAGVFGFYPNKQVTTGEGGMIVTNRDEWADFMRSLRNQGRAPGDSWLEHTYLGYNYRMDEVSAALGRVQMGRLDEMLESRAKVAAWYNERLGEVEWIETINVVPSTTRMSWFVYVIRLREGVDRRMVTERLAAQSIPTRPYFAPIHLQRFYVDQFGFRPGDFPETESLGNRSLALPFSGRMSVDEVDAVCEALIRAAA